MKQIIITVESDDEVNTILDLLTEAEEECVIDFCFNTEVETK